MPVCMSDNECSPHFSTHLLMCPSIHPTTSPSFSNLLPSDSHCHLSPDGQSSVTVLCHTDHSHTVTHTHTDTYLLLSNYNLAEYLEQVALSDMKMGEIPLI